MTNEALMTKETNLIIELFRLERELEATKPTAKNLNTLNVLKASLIRTQTMLDQTRFLLQNPDMVSPFD